MTQIAAQRYTGTSVKRSEDPRILTGAGRYVDDVKLPGLLHAAFVRSPLAHGRVLAVDVSAAAALPGVVAVFTGADLDTMTVRGPDPLLAYIGMGAGGPDYSLLATDKVRFAGDPVAVVVAESRYLAEDGCELVEVDYEDLPTVASAASALDLRHPARRCSPISAATSSPGTRRSEFGDVAETRRSRERIDRAWPEFHLRRCIVQPGRADGGTRHRGEPRRRLGPADHLRVNAERAAHQEGDRRPPRPRGGEGACPGRGHRRLVRLEDRRLAGGARRRGRVLVARPAGQVDRGPERAPHRVGPGP